MDDTEKRILVIGGNSGIGAALLKKLGATPAKLFVAARTEPSHASAFEYQRLDVTDPLQTLQLPETLDALIYLPGTINLKPFHRLSTDDFARDIQVNLLGAVHVLQQALPALKKAASKSASVLLFSSVAATTGMPFHASIASAKGAVEALARSLAAEFAPIIRFNVIAPSLTDTPLAASLLGSEERTNAAAKRHPLDRIGTPEEVAELAAFLVTDASSFVTGQTYRVDGGLSSLRQF